MIHYACLLALGAALTHPAPPPAPAAPLPLRVGAVSDYAGTLDAASRDWLCALSDSLPGVDLAVAILPAAGTASPTQAAQALAAQWRLGRGFPRGGVLVAFYLAERTVQVVPRGAAANRLAADTCRTISHQIIAPYCRQQRFGDGAVAGCYAISRTLGADPVALTGRAAPALDPGERTGLSTKTVLQVLGITLLLPLLVVGALVARQWWRYGII